MVQVAKKYPDGLPTSGLQIYCEVVGREPATCYIVDGVCVDKNKLIIAAVDRFGLDSDVTVYLGRLK